VFAVFSGNDSGCEFHYYSPVEKRWYKIDKLYPTGKSLFHHHIYDPVNNVHILASRGPDYFWQTLAFKLSDTPGKFSGTGINHPSTESGGAFQIDRICELQTSPNPFRASIRIKLQNTESRTAYTYFFRIFDVHGKLIFNYKENIRNPEPSIVWDASGLSPGVYLISVLYGKTKITKRVTLLK
jgi:hypothetical protein